MWWCFLALAVQEVVYYLYIQERGTNGRYGASLLGRTLPAAAVALAAACPLLHAGVRYFCGVPRRWVRVAQLSVLVGGLGLLVGAALRNEVRYLASDCLRYGMAWLTLLVAAAAAVRIARCGGQRHLFYFVDILAVIALADAVLTLQLYFLFPRWKIATTLYLFAIPWGLLQTRWPRSVGLAALTLGLLAMFLSGRRGSLIAVAAFSPVLLWYQFNSLRTLVFNALWGGLALLVCMTAVQAGMSNFRQGDRFRQRGTRLVHNVYEIVIEGRSDLSMEHRMEEVRNIIEYFRESPYLLPTGGGFGAETEMIYDSNVYSISDRMHQVHIAWAAYLLRNGIPGIILLGTFCLASARFIFTRRRGQAGTYVKICGAFVAISLIQSLKDQLMLEYVAVPLIVGLAVGLMEADRVESAGQLARREHLRRQPRPPCSRKELQPC